MNLFNKIGYGTGDWAANMVYGLVTSFALIYLTNTVGLNAGIVGTLIMLSKFADGISDVLFGTLIDRTNSKLGKARPWMLYSYIGNAVCLIAVFAIPASMGDAAKYIYFFITYTLLNAVFYTANNISYSALTSLITRNSAERVQMGTFRFIFATAANLFVSNFTLVLVEKFGGGAAGWRSVALLFAVIGLIVNTFSVFSVRELPAEDFKGEELSEVPADGKKVGLVDTLKTLVKNPYFDMLTMIYVLGYMSVSLSFGVAVYYFMYIMGDANRYGKLMTMYSCTSFGMKVGSGIGSGLSGWLLAASGFDAAAAVQSAACNNMPIFMFAGIPLLVTVATTIIYYFLKVEKVNRTLAS